MQLKNESESLRKMRRGGEGEIKEDESIYDPRAKNRNGGTGVKIPEMAMRYI